MTGLIAGAEYNAQTTLSGIPAMVMAHVKPIAVNYVMWVNPFATNVAKTVHIHIWWYKDNGRINPVQRKLRPSMCLHFSGK